MSDVRLAQRAQDGIADGVHEGIRIRMAVQALAVRDFHAAQDELASGDQLMNIVANANVNHGGTIKNFQPGPKHKDPKSAGRNNPA